MRSSKSSAPGLDDISNLAWKNGGDNMAFCIMDLVETACGDEALPEDINLSIVAFLDKTPEAPADGHTPAMIFTHPLDTRPLSSKQADNEQVARVLNFCISLVVEKCAIGTKRGLIHGGQLAQNVVDLHFRARMDAFDFSGMRQYVKLIHMNSIGVVGSLPYSCLYDFASAIPSVAHAWLFCILEVFGIWDSLWHQKLAQGQ